MSAEGVTTALVVNGITSGSGVAVAGMLLTADQSLGLGAIGGCCMFLAASATLPIGSKILYAIFSFIVGYFVGILVLGVWSNTAGAAIASCFVSAVVSWFAGSLKAWSEGGPRPDWIDLLLGLMPAFLQRGKKNE